MHAAGAGAPGSTGARCRWRGVEKGAWTGRRGPGLPAEGAWPGASGWRRGQVRGGPLGRAEEGWRPSLEGIG